MFININYINCSDAITTIIGHIIIISNITDIETGDEYHRRYMLSSLVYSYHQAYH